MNKIRPMRNYEIFTALCIDCNEEEVESRQLPIPLRCNICEMKFREEQKKRETTAQIEETLKIISKGQERSRNNPVTPENCKFCNSKRVGIQEQIVYFQCKTIYDYTTKIPVWNKKCNG